jgi:single-stranded DNA-binding protein
LAIPEKVAIDMSLNRAILSGTVSQYGVKISWTESGKPQTSFALAASEPGKDGTSYRTFIPVLIVGAQAEDLAATLEPGDPVLLEGKLTYQSGKTKDAGRLVVSCFTVEVLSRQGSAQAALMDEAKSP